MNTMPMAMRFRGQASVDLYLNNVDIDVADDLRRSVTRSIAEFEASQLEIEGELRGLVLHLRGELGQRPRVVRGSSRGELVQEGAERIEVRARRRRCVAASATRRRSGRHTPSCCSSIRPPDLPRSPHKDPHRSLLDFRSLDSQRQRREYHVHRVSISRKA